MRYHCRDCSYQGNGLRASGSCPACGSFNMAGAAAPEAQAKPRRLQLAILVLLWVTFAALVLAKLVS